MSLSRVAATIGVAAVALGLGCRSSGPSHQALFQARLEAAKAGTGPEQIVEGTIEATGGTTKTPRGDSGVVAWAAWKQVRMSAGSDLYRGEALELGSVPFTLQTADGPVRVDGTLTGLSDLVVRDRGPTSEVEVSVQDQDQVTLLGPIEKRDGGRSVSGELVLVKGSYEQWHAALAKNFFASLPQPSAP